MKYKICANLYINKYRYYPQVVRPDLIRNRLNILTIFVIPGACKWQVSTGTNPIGSLKIDYSHRKPT